VSAAGSDDDIVPDADGIERRTFGIGGAALSGLAAGPEDGDLVVLLHGIPASAELWRGVLVRLGAAGFRAIAFDLPGYGQTLVPARSDHSLAGAAELIATWLKIEVTGPAWVVGHDLGGGVAQILASRHPTLLSRLTLADTVVEGTWPVTTVRVLQRVARAGLYPALAAARLIPNPYVWRELRRGFADPARLPPADADRVFWDGKLRDPDGRRAFARHLAALDPAQTAAAMGNLARLTIPTQLVWGRQDVFQPWDVAGVRLQAHLPDPTVTLLDDAGHFAPLEQPEAFAAALLAPGTNDPGSGDPGSGDPGTSAG
jgi:2-hydroxymuconate-semialdehyde hydrolase